MSNEFHPSAAIERVLQPDLPAPPAGERLDASASVVAVARDHVALQFVLAGIRVEEVNTASDAEDSVEELLDEPLELVVVDARFRDGFSAVFNSRLADHRGLPLVVFCPQFEDDADDADEQMAAELKRVIGHEIRLD